MPSDWWDGCPSNLRFLVHSCMIREANMRYRFAKRPWHKNKDKLERDIRSWVWEPLQYSFGVTREMLIEYAQAK